MSQTPLSRMLSESISRPDALTAFRAARAAFLDGQRLEMQELARHLGVSRATLFRWVGGRDQLIAEIIWSITEPTFQAARARHLGETGGRLVADVLGTFATYATTSQPFMNFVQSDPERALRLLTTRATDFQARLKGMIESLLRQEIDAGRIEPPLPLGDLAYLVLRIAETFIYADVIAGEVPDPAKVRQAVQALLRD